jgi:nucleotide-binding universal stress UspA family protein
VRKSWEKKQIKKVLVPVDFSPYSKKAIGKGLDIALEYGAQIIFMHSVEQEAHPAFYATQLESIFKTNPQLKRKIKENLIQFAEMPAEDAIFDVVEGKAHKAITQYAQENEADLIVMATRGMGALDHLLLGSNAERVTRSTEIPVLTVGRK